MRTRDVAARTSLLALSSLAATGALGAQAPDTAAVLEPGRRVRVTSRRAPAVFRSPYREGVLARLDADSLRLVRTPGDTIAIARLDVRRVEVLVRRGSERRNLLVGGIVGAIGGGVVGVALGSSMGDGCAGIDGCTSSTDVSGSLAAGAAFGGALGVFAGALVGTQRWRVVPLDGARVGVSLRR